MTATGVGTDPVTAGDAGDPAAGGRRPWWVWAVPFALLFALLCVRNRFLFTTRLYEDADRARRYDPRAGRRALRIRHGGCILRKGGPCLVTAELDCGASVS